MAHGERHSFNKSLNAPRLVPQKVVWKSSQSRSTTCDAHHTPHIKGSPYNLKTQPIGGGDRLSL